MPYSIHYLLKPLCGCLLAHFELAVITITRIVAKGESQIFCFREPFGATDFLNRHHIALFWIHSMKLNGVQRHILLALLLVVDISKHANLANLIFSQAFLLFSLQVLGTVFFLVFI